MSDFVKPEIVRLPLSDGQFIDVKKRLSHGEREDMFTNMSPYVTPGEVSTISRGTVRTEKVLTYLVGWSLTDEGQPVNISPQVKREERIDTIRMLSTERFDEIFQAILTHEEGGAAGKKAPDGVTGLPAISPSPSNAAGVTKIYAT
jgi:hypothetical protein